MTFTSLPKLDINLEDGTVKLHGCGYTSTPSKSVPKNIIFHWIFDNSSISSQSVTPIHGQDLPPFPSLPFNSYDQAGTYACRISIGTQMFQSENFVLDKLPG